MALGMAGAAPSWQGNDPAGPPRPTVIDFPVRSPSATERKIAFKYAAEWCRSSAEFVQKKVAHWERLFALYEHLIGYRDFCSGTVPEAVKSLYLSRAGRTFLPTETDQSKWSDWLFAPAYIIDRIVTNAFPSIFLGSDWLVIERMEGDEPPEPPEPAEPAMPDPQMMGAPAMPGMMPDGGLGPGPGMVPPPDEQDDLPIQQKVQRFLIQELQRGKIESRVYDALQACITFGTVWGKVFMWTPTKNKGVFDLDTLETRVVQDQDHPIPVVQTIPLDLTLPDPHAEHTDIERWSGIGHRVVRSVAECLDFYRTGEFNLNKAKFMDLFPLESTSSESEISRISGDDDANDISSPIPRCKLWVVQLKVPLSEGLTELSLTIATDVNSSDPSSGVMTRCDYPMLRSRPYVVAHFFQQPRPFGLGVLDRNEDLIQIISERVNQISDNARVTCVGANCADPTSDYYRQTQADGGVITPGKTYAARAGWPGDIPVPVPIAGFNSQVLREDLAYWMETLERRIITDAYAGVGGGGRKTAMEIQTLQAQSQTPVQTLIHMFALNFLKPAASIALEMLTHNVDPSQDREVMIQNTFGFDVPITISAAELKGGRFIVTPSLTKQDSTRLAKAQTIQQAMQEILQVQGVLTSEGWVVEFGELLLDWADLLGIDGIGRKIRRISTKEQQYQQTIANLSAQLQQLQGAMPNGGGMPPGGAGPVPPGGSAPPPGPGPMGPIPTDANMLAGDLRDQGLTAQGGNPYGS